MNELEIFNLYEKTPKLNKSFSNSLDSKLEVTNNLEQVECDIEWLEIMENTIRYIDNILRNPNRFIVNEEDIVKIELARRVTVDSIKHLSRNTNLIQKIEDNGDVKPSKILNINKEESFNTYENRFVYSLIQNMRMYIDRKKRTLEASSTFKSNKKLDYTGATSISGEKVSISLSLETHINKKDDHKDNNDHDLLERIERLESNLTDLMSSSLYQTLAKLHLSLVTSPIKKTNVILKNTNFQYALKLWNYMQENMEDKTKRNKKNETYEDKGLLKKYMDDTFQLNYIVANSIGKENVITKEDKKEISKQLIGNAISKVVQLNPNIDEQELSDMIGEQIVIIKNKNVVNTDDISKKFKTAINDYMKQIDDFKF